jgi:hypothetical protein
MPVYRMPKVGEKVLLGYALYDKFCCTVLGYEGDKRLSNLDRPDFFVTTHGYHHDKQSYGTRWIYASPLANLLKGIS